MTIGSGGFGQVVLVIRKKDGKLVVCKTIKASSVSRRDPDGYPIEVSLHERCHGHPNIVTLLESFYCPGQKVFRLLMPYLQGAEDLLTWRYKRAGIIDLPILKLFLIQMLDALGHIHGQGVVHCDVKPQNMLVVPDAKDPYNKYSLAFLDFGEAVEYKKGKKDFRYMGGTPVYDGPEFDQPALKLEGPEADVFALGVTTYEIVFGKRPFADRDEINDLNRVLIPPTEAPDSDGRLRKVPWGLYNLIVGMTAKKPEDRLTIAQIRQSDWLTGS